MSKIRTSHVFTSESVGKGHPDKLCDQVSDAILDACLGMDPHCRVACETMAGFNMVVNVGEITCRDFDRLDTETITRDTVKSIGYDCADLRFCHDTFEYLARIHGQSPDISQGVTEGEGLYVEQGAGDQGMMFGYATNETPEMLPVPIAFSHRLLRRFEKLRRNKSIGYLRPDAKAQVSVHYAGGKPRRITSVVLSHQTGPVSPERIRRDATDVIRQELAPSGLLDEQTEFYVNPTGSFILGGPFADAGLTGRKIIVDTYGGVGSHGGGAFSGKDPSKVDRSAAYFARYTAKNIVAAGLAEKCEIKVAYAIGVAKPLSINIDTYGTGLVDEALIQGMLEDGDLFDFRPAAIIDQLGLLKPKGWKYETTAAYGHFGRDRFPWEKPDKVDVLKRVFKKMRAA